MLPFGEIWNRVLKSSSEIRIRGVAAVKGPPGGVDGQLLQVGKAAILRNAGYLARRQNGKTAQVDRFCTLGLQIIIQKSVVTDFVVGVVGYVLRHIGG